MKKNVVIILIILSIGIFCGQAGKEQTLDVWDLLKKLVLVPGVSGQENKVADSIRGLFPPGVEPQKDEMGNIWFSAGSGSPHILFVAHTDEIGLLVRDITPEGTLKVKARGSFLAQMYEGHIVIIYGEKGPVEGIVFPRSNYSQKQLKYAPFKIEDMKIYLGVSSKEEASELGIKKGNQVIIKKKIIELGPDIIAARAVDDRAGCSALLSAASQINWQKIRDKKITFAWVVQEEVGIKGASFLAQTLKPDYVFPVDTFPSSDAPLDSKRFANAILGKGAVLSAVDSSNKTPRKALNRVRDIAKKHNIPLQLGNTRGVYDGLAFVPGGAIDIPLSWPGNYSHSFIEKIHRLDLEALTRLIVAIVKDW